MSNGWTPERRARQRAAIQRWQPWARSTGPRTATGKALSSKNADKGKVRSTLREVARELHMALHMQSCFFEKLAVAQPAIDRDEQQDPRLIES